MRQWKPFANDKGARNHRGSNEAVPDLLNQTDIKCYFFRIITIQNLQGMVI